MDQAPTKKIKWSVHLNTLVFVFLIVIGGTAPLWLGLLVSTAWSSWHGLEHFLHKGELYLFSAAFFTHAIYLLFEHKKRNYDYLAITAWISIILLMVSAAIYATIITPAELLGAGVPHLNTSFIAWSSFVCLMFSLVALYIGMYKDNEKKDGIDVASEIREEVEELKSKLA